MHEFLCVCVYVNILNRSDPTHQVHEQHQACGSYMFLFSQEME